MADQHRHILARTLLAFEILAGLLAVVGLFELLASRRFYDGFTASILFDGGAYTYNEGEAAGATSAASHEFAKLVGENYENIVFLNIRLFDERSAASVGDTTVSRGSNPFGEPLLHISSAHQGSNSSFLLLEGDIDGDGPPNDEIAFNVSVECKMADRSIVSRVRGANPVIPKYPCGDFLISFDESGIDQSAIALLDRTSSYHGYGSTLRGLFYVTVTFEEGVRRVRLIPIAADAQSVDRYHCSASIAVKDVFLKIYNYVNTCMLGQFDHISLEYREHIIGPPNNYRDTPN